MEGFGSSGFLGCRAEGLGFKATSCFVALLPLHRKEEENGKCNDNCTGYRDIIGFGVSLLAVSEEREKGQEN